MIPIGWLSAIPDKMVSRESCALLLVESVLFARGARRATTR